MPMNSKGRKIVPPKMPPYDLLRRAMDKMEDEAEAERIASLTPEQVRQELRDAGISEERMDEAKRKMRERMAAFNASET
jgi:hypothetical protein